MEKVKMVTLTLVAVLLVLVPKSQCQIRPRPPPLTPRPLCASQFSLANYACTRLPLRPLPPTPPPAPPSPDDEEEGEGHRHKHEHRHRHRHRQHGSPEEENCCRWVSQVDSQCVCEVLFLLPSFANFLMRPVHEITLSISNSCNVSYACGGAILRG